MMMIPIVSSHRPAVSSLPFRFSLLRRLPGHSMDKIPASDIRDWTEIQEWAIGIARQIKASA